MNYLYESVCEIEIAHKVHILGLTEFMNSCELFANFLIHYAIDKTLYTHIHTYIPTYKATTYGLTEKNYLTQNSNGMWQNAHPSWYMYRHWLLQKCKQHQQYAYNKFSNIVHWMMDYNISPITLSIGGMMYKFLILYTFLQINCSFLKVKICVTWWWPSYCMYICQHSFMYSYACMYVQYCLSTTSHSRAKHSWVMSCNLSSKIPLCFEQNENARSSNARHKPQCSDQHSTQGFKVIHQKAIHWHTYIHTVPPKRNFTYSR